MEGMEGEKGSGENGRDRGKVGGGRVEGREGEKGGTEGKRDRGKVGGGRLEGREVEKEGGAFDAISNCQ